MVIRTLASIAEKDSVPYRPYLNTGGPLDILNGKYIGNVHGGMALSGGIGLTNAVIAKPNRFKSTLMHSSVINAMARFPDSFYVNKDSEYTSSDINRIANFSNRFMDDPIKREEHVADLRSRIRLLDAATHDEARSLDAFLDYVKVIRDEKIAHAKDYTVEAEVLDPDTGKPYRMLMPTFVGIDSWTEAVVELLHVKNDEIDADTDDSKTKDISMAEGRVKTRLMRQLPRIAAQAGIYFFMTGHLGEKVNMGGRPTQKDMAYMGQDETVKGMGPKFYFLMSSIWRIANTKPLLYDADKTALYPSEQSMSSTELQELIVSHMRGKNNNSGGQAEMVSSQKFGIQATLSYYNYLRANKYYGLGNPRSTKSPLLPNEDLGRTKIFDKSGDPKIARALQLSYELFTIQNTWTLKGQPVDYSISIETFCEKLQKSGYAVDDILNSRGWWTYKGAKDAEQPYLTLPDILMMLDGTYKPKFMKSAGIPV